MSVKIHVSYQTEAEEEAILQVLRPIMDGFRVKKSTDKPPISTCISHPRKPGSLAGTGIPLDTPSPLWYNID